MSPGSFIYWRFKKGPYDWKWGWVAEHLGQDLVRLGHYNGDSRGTVVSPSEIEWRAA